MLGQLGRIISGLWSSACSSLRIKKGFTSQFGTQFQLLNIVQNKLMPWRGDTNVTNPISGENQMNLFLFFYPDFIED